jgi:hypothetical protein
METLGSCGPLFQNSLTERPLSISTTEETESTEAEKAALLPDRSLHPFENQRFREAADENCYRKIGNGFRRCSLLDLQ